MLYLLLVCSGLILLEITYAKYNNYDNFNMEALLLNSTQSKLFFECISDESKCKSKADREMKHDMMEMVSTSCAYCTEKEKKKYTDAMKALRRSMDDSQMIAMFVNKITDMFHTDTTN